MKKGIYITTPIYYINGDPHIGHVYTTVAADVIARYYRLLNYPVLFLTGTDEHGQKVQEAAIKHQYSLDEYVNKMAIKFKELWKALNISNTDFIRTTEGRHIKVVQGALDFLYKKGDIYFNSYEGWYCLTDERFWIKRDLIEGRCPECGSSVKYIRENNYFFRMSKYQKWLIKYISEHSDYIQPIAKRNEVIGFLQNPLSDLCISRPKSRLSWGISLPFDENYVTYVWFDALINYISVPGYLSNMDYFNKWWPADYHLIGKDILITHSVYWSIMLKALGIEPPKRIFAHGWWTISGEKMSKSRGNVVNPIDIIKEFGVDAFRYYLLREMAFGLDGDFSKEAMIRRVNSDLVNGLGNLLNRTLTMVEKYMGGYIQPNIYGKNTDDINLKIQSLFSSLLQEYTSFMDKLQFSQALILIWHIIKKMNEYINAVAPWKEKNSRILSDILYNLIEGLRIIAVYIYPFMPNTAQKIWQQLGLESSIASLNLTKEVCWGGIKQEIKIKKDGVLFPKINTVEKNFI